MKGFRTSAPREKNRRNHYRRAGLVVCTAITAALICLFIARNLSVGCPKWTSTVATSYRVKLVNPHSSKSMTGGERPEYHSPAHSSSPPHPNYAVSFSMPARPPCISLMTGNLPTSRILVTGAAGFIGYHTANALAVTPSSLVIGLDNFNSVLYDAVLKRRRQVLLRSCCNVSVLEGDIRNATLLKQLFSCYAFTQVVHLAAQAGVRMSVQQPTLYVSSNVEGTVTLLEAVRQQQRPASIVYASSSSVYGLLDRSSNSSNSLCFSDNCCTSGGDMLPSKECYAKHGTPTSLYAASKRATEEAVAVYHHQYGVTAIGLRFFTVYGSCGRPDMAVMKLADSLKQGIPINITCFPATPARQQLINKLQQARKSDIALPLNSSNLITLPTRSFLQYVNSSGSEVTSRPHRGLPCVPAYRDFTHVSDIVQGVTAACRSAAATAQAAHTRSGTASHKVYNLGRGQPASTVELLHMLQKLLQRRAVSVQYVQARQDSKADVWLTWADTSAAQQELGCFPQVNLEQGLNESVDWHEKGR